MSAEAVTTTDPRRPRWILYTLLGVFGLLYAYAVWNAIAYMIPLVGLAVDATTWVALILAIVMPVIVYALAVALTRRRGLGVLALVLLAGLGVVAVFWLDVVGYTLSGGH
ncbi:conserved membrane hypothetical protein [Microbacterium sp. 8M]|jgi:hypothetical protein|uniref:hypothetical protein n=1 Tax=Microbacterium sp. 8M TaxID=2653153 RepID=UPI0012EF2144|nr:hypothetical protein [Microbacterium sp. 8M]VXB00864.1 conserved membrane hypothetical protein [Microbacterium sp. 8M]